MAPGPPFSSWHPGRGGRGREGWVQKGGWGGVDTWWGPAARPGEMLAWACAANCPAPTRSVCRGLLLRSPESNSAPLGYGRVRFRASLIVFPWGACPLTTCSSPWAPVFCLAISRPRPGVGTGLVHAFAPRQHCEVLLTRIVQVAAAR